MADYTIRPIELADNPVIAQIIRATLTEFGANREGTVFTDPTTDHLFELFRKAGSYYLVAGTDNQILGGGGLYPSDGLPEDTCELVKMYLLPEARGKGLGRKIIEQLIDKAGTLGYKNVYIETMPELQKAMKVYEQFGFEYIDKPMGNTGHFGCSIWMKKIL